MGGVTGLRRLATAAAALALGLGSAVPEVHAASDWGRIPAPSGEAVVAGTTTEIRWTALPEDIDEFELLLSLDDGRSFAVRLTPQLDPAVGMYAWRVPNIPAARARLRLRVGRGGHEVEGPPGPAFAIVRDRALPESGLEHRAGEWWPVASSQAIATWVARSPGGLSSVTSSDPKIGEGWIGPQVSVPRPAPARFPAEPVARSGRSSSGDRPDLSRPTPDPPLRP
jgi:hypothetical protein